MYTVKRFRKGDILGHKVVNGRIVGTYIAQSTYYAVVTPEGEISKVKNPLTGKVDFETFNLKSAAIQQAEWYNNQL